MDFNVSKRKEIRNNSRSEFQYLASSTKALKNKTMECNLRPYHLLQERIVVENSSRYISYKRIVEMCITDKMH